MECCFSVENIKINFLNLIFPTGCYWFKYIFECKTLYLYILLLFYNVNVKYLLFYRLELNMELPSGVPSTSIGQSTVVSQEQDELTQRLARLRQAE